MPGCLSRSPTKNSAATGLLLISESKCGRHCSEWCPPWHLGGQWGSLALASSAPVSLNQASDSWNPLDSRHQEGIRHAGQRLKECQGRITGRLMKDSETLGLAYVVKGDGSRGGRGWGRKRIKPQSSASILVAKWTKRSPQSRGMAMAHPSPHHCPIIGWKQSQGNVSLGIHMVGSKGVGISHGGQLCFPLPPSRTVIASWLIMNTSWAFIISQAPCKEKTFQFIFPFHLPNEYKDYSLVSKFNWDLFSCSVMSDSLQPHGLHHARLLCPLPSSLTLCNPMDCSTPGFPVLYHLLELAQTLLHWVDDAIHPSHPLSAPPPPAFYFSQRQGLFQWVGSSLQVVKLLELQHQSFQWIFRVDFL